MMGWIKVQDSVCDHNKEWSYICHLRINQDIFSVPSGQWQSRVREIQVPITALSGVSSVTLGISRYPSELQFLYL